MAVARIGWHLDCRGGQLEKMAGLARLADGSGPVVRRGRDKAAILHVRLLAFHQSLALTGDRCRFLDGD